MIAEPVVGDVDVWRNSSSEPVSLRGRAILSQHNKYASVNVLASVSMLEIEHKHRSVEDRCFMRIWT